MHRRFEKAGSLYKCNCSRTSSWQRVAAERKSDGVDDADPPSSRGFDDGSDVGVEVCAPSGSQAIGDFSKDDAWPRGLLGAVVGGRDVAIGDENKQVLAEALDDALELVPWLGGGHDFEQHIEAGLGDARDRWPRSRRPGSGGAVRSEWRASAGFLCRARKRCRRRRSPA